MFTLKSLDLSNNPQLGDISVLQVLHGLKNKIKVNGKVEQPQLTELNLKNTDMGEKSMDFLGQLMTCNTTLTRIDLSYNIIRPSLVEEVQLNCNRNKTLS